jgi:hypothetical protein
MAAPFAGGHFWLRDRARAMAMSEDRHDWADLAGRRIATAFIVLLAAMFAYGYLGWLVGG